MVYGFELSKAAIMMLAALATIIYTLLCMAMSEDRRRRR